MRSAITISLVPEARGGPFVFWDDLADGCQAAAALGFDAVEVFPRSAQELDVTRLKQLLAQHRLRLAAVGTGAGWMVHKLRLTDLDAESLRLTFLAYRDRMKSFAAEGPWNYVQIFKNVGAAAGSSGPASTCRRASEPVPRYGHLSGVGRGGDQGRFRRLQTAGCVRERPGNAR